MFPFICISPGTSAHCFALDLLFVKQWYSRAPNKLPTRNDTTNEVIVDAIATLVYSSSTVIPEINKTQHIIDNQI